MASPISLTIELSRCWTTDRVMGSITAVIRSLGSKIFAEIIASSGTRSIHSLFNHFVSTAKQRRRHVKAKRLCDFEVDDQIELGGALDGQIGGTGAAKKLLNGKNQG